MADFSVQVQGLDQLVAKLKSAPDIAAPILQRAIDRSHSVLASHTVKGIVPWRTGFLATQWGWKSTFLSGRWFPRASYAPYVEFGTKPHVIEPKDKKALFWKGADHPVRRVNHPGTKPNDFMGRILAASQDEIDTAFMNALKQITAAIAAQ